MKISRQIPVAILAFVLSCGDNNKSVTDAAPDVPEMEIDDGFRQVEMLARPGINEALLISQDFLNAYNATAPTFAGVPASALNAVVAEAKTVLKALYLGTCLLNGVAGLTGAAQLKPAGMMCHATGDALFTMSTGFDGTVLTDASKTAAQTYADTVFGLFIPDVMRIDTTVESGYLTPCGAGMDAPLLCGGRKLNDDTIDITYHFLLDGVDATHTATQYKALTSDGVNYSTTAAAQHGTGSRFAFDDTDNNPQQGHPSVSNEFPYSAPPL